MLDVEIDLVGDKRAFPLRSNSPDYREEDDRKRENISKGGHFLGMGEFKPWRTKLRLLARLNSVAREFWNSVHRLVDCRLRETKHKPRR